MPDFLEGHPEAQRITRLLTEVEYRRHPLAAEIREIVPGNFPWSVTRIQLKARVKDVTDPMGRVMTLYAPAITVRPEFSDEWIVFLVYKAIQEFELHELDEHFFVKGVKVADPHDSRRAWRPQMYRNVDPPTLAETQEIAVK